MNEFFKLDGQTITIVDWQGLADHILKTLLTRADGFQHFTEVDTLSMSYTLNSGNSPSETVDRGSQTERHTVTEFAVPNGLMIDFPNSTKLPAYKISNPKMLAGIFARLILDIMPRTLEVGKSYLMVGKVVFR